MTDLSQLSTEELMQMRGQPQGIDLSSFSTEELMQMRGEPQATGLERLMGTPVNRAILGAADLPISLIQGAANIGEKLADVTGLTGKFGKTKFVPASSVSNIPESGEGFGEVPGGIDAQSINRGVAELDAMKRRGMSSLSGRPVGEEFDVAGTAGALIPGIAVYKGIAKLLPKAISESGKLPGRTIGRMLSGGGTAVTTIPDTSGGEDFFQDKAIQTFTGAMIPVGMSTLGSLIKGIWKVGKAGVGSLRDTLRNFSEEGTEELTKSHIQQLGKEGGEKAAKKTVGSLLKPETILSKPTAADSIAAGNVTSPAERFGGPLVRLQSELAGLTETTTKLRSTETAQEFARVQALAKIAGTESEKKIAKAAVSKAGAAYSDIKSTIVKSNSTLDNIRKSPAFRAAEKRAFEISQNANAVAKANKERVIPFLKKVDKLNSSGNVVLNAKGKPVKITQYSAQGLQHIKQVLDEMSENPTLRSQLGITGTEGVTIGKVRESLVKWMDKNVDGWKAAREAYKEAKTVTNRMEIGKSLGEKLQGPRGEERPAQFLQAQRDATQTIKKSTGRPLSKNLEDYLTPEQMNTVNNITKELERDSMVTRMTREVNIPGATSPVSGNMAKLPSPLYRPTMIANWFLKSTEEEGNKAVNRKAAEILSDPKKAAEILSEMPPKWRKGVVEALQKFHQFSKDPINVAAIQALDE